MKSRYFSLASLKRKLLLKPCKKIAKFFIKLRRRKPLSMKSLHFRRRRDEREMDRVTELTSFSDAVQQHQRAPHPSPLTPAYVRMSAAATATKLVGGEEDDDDVEEACRSFEKYVMEIIVDEGKMRDLRDVEELLYLWEELTSPVFLDLVCRFYRELCTDLFSTTTSHDNHITR